MSYHRTKLESGLLGVNSKQAHHILGQITKQQRYELYTTMCDILTGNTRIQPGENMIINDGNYQLISQINKQIQLYYTTRNYK